MVILKTPSPPKWKKSCENVIFNVLVIIELLVFCQYIYLNTINTVQICFNFKVLGHKKAYKLPVRCCIITLPTLAHKLCANYHPANINWLINVLTLRKKL